MNPKRNFWNDETIEQEIRKSMGVLLIDRMPTAEEFKMIGRNDLHCKISKTKKYSGWAQYLGLSLKSCDTRTGQAYEEVAMQMLAERFFDVERMTTKHAYDLLVDGRVKVDVKVAKPNRAARGCRAHAFGISKTNQTCDIYICIAVDESDKIEKVYVIPSHLARVQTLSVGAESKYDRFIDAWQYVEQYAAFMEKIV